jgi:hypothetical protein
MRLRLRNDRKRIPFVELASGILPMLVVFSTIACGEKPCEAQAPVKAVAPAPDPAPAVKPVDAQALFPADPAASLPDEIRAQLPVGAALREVITGKGAVSPPGAAGESHQRHPYDLPDGTAGIVAVVTWKDTAWKEIEIAVGIGPCPHRGRKLESARSSSGRAALHHAVQADEALADDKWFLHVNADAGLAANPGESLPYSYAVYSY